jgi:hypothetical protein
MHIELDATVRTVFLSAKDAKNAKRAKTPNAAHQAEFHETLMDWLCFSLRPLRPLRINALLRLKGLDP